MKNEALYDHLFDNPTLPIRLREKGYQAAIKKYLDEVIVWVQFPKAFLLLSPSHIAGHIYFVLKGLARAFIYDEKNNRQVTYFIFTGQSFVTDPESFFQQTPSLFFIEAMPGSEMLSINYPHYSECAKRFPETEIFTRYLLLRYNNQHSTRIQEMASLDSWQRYLNLLKVHPNIEQQVSKEVIASYLNIAPQSLSRLLKENRHP